MTTQGTRPPRIARNIRRFAALIIIGWVALTLLVTFGVPRLEIVGQQHSVPLAPQDAPAVQAMQRMGRDFKESDSDSFAMLVIEGQQQLGDSAHAYYAKLVRELKSDTKHIEHVQDLWGDRLTAAGAQSPDGKAVYVQLNLAGNQGTTQGQESVAAIRDIIERTPPPPGIQAYVTGPAALFSDMQLAGDRSILKMTMIGALIIFIVLLFVYRSVITVILLLLTVGIEVFAARGVIAFIADHNLIALSTFAVNLLVALAMAAGTDYAIFFFGRYQEARQAGEDRETAFFTTYRSVSPVVLGSGLTIAGAMLCLSFTRMPIFQTMGLPCSLGMLISVLIALTLVPAVLTVGGGVGLFDPTRTIGFGRWRRIGTAIVRWPAPILCATIAIAIVGLATLPGYKTSYNNRLYMPNSVPANVGYAAADRHFNQSRMMPEIVMIEADHDLRNSADFLVLHRLAKAIFGVHGISRVQGITRPEGTPIQHTSIPFLLSMQQAMMSQDIKYMQLRMDDMLVQADMMAKQIEIMKRIYSLQKRMTDITHDTIVKTKEMAEVIYELRGHMSDFEDFFRPLRSYFYWEKHCYDIPICWSLRQIFEILDGVDTLSDKLTDLLKDLDNMDKLMPQLLEQYPPMIAMSEDMRQMMLTNHSTMSGIIGQMDSNNKDAVAMGEAFDASKNDDSFYLPPDIFDNADFKKAMSQFLSPDGKAARFIISHRGDPATSESVARIDKIRQAAEEALKNTPLENAKINIAGTASTFKDFRDGSTYDLLIAGVGALCLIFIIMLIITRSFIAALVIVGTVTLSLGASFGLSVLIWQYIFGIELYWMVLPMSVIVLLAVGSDYNLLLVSRMKEEIAAGINTGIIRAMGGTGKVVTNAGLVFAFTMASMVVSDLRIIGQVGTTIGLGLMFDTLIVRSFMTPTIAALLGRWFWWPLLVRPRPASLLLRSVGTRPSVRTLLREDDDADAPTAEIPIPRSTV
ncbi:RND family transporter [Mycobacterium sp. WUMAC-067]|uniref:MMPL/RND family transporter n=1 Tax=unclassified Mycobacterium TaxID=2642494 RepID=UPI001CD93948|nr:MULTISPECIES: RND family transporter [unclassified Mycobacterium]MCA2243328.1 RND family transporter [Mycobacterium sp. WUMAC-067]MCA2314318.1 RND family transporter [Mycobacterium sp. WUMAC-025]